MLSLYQSTSLSVSELVCLFVPKLLRNGEPQPAENLRDDSPWDGEGFRLKNIRIRRTVSWKIACIMGMYTSDPSGQYDSFQYITYLGGW